MFFERDQRDLIIESLNVETGGRGDGSAFNFFLIELGEKEHSDESVHEISIGVII